MRNAKEVIYKHLSDNDGWIPVEEHLPGEEDLIKNSEFIVMINGATIPTTLYYYSGYWSDDNDEFYDVIAWRPLPEPYRKDGK